MQQPLRTRHVSLRPPEAAAGGGCRRPATSRRSRAWVALLVFFPHRALTHAISYMAELRDRERHASSLDVAIGTVPFPLDHVSKTCPRGTTGAVPVAQAGRRRAAPCHCC